jgi:hypothetical protein
MGSGEYKKKLVYVGGTLNGKYDGIGIYNDPF